MQILYLNNLQTQIKQPLLPTVYCLGMFDSFHTAHQQLTNTAQAKAKATKNKLGVITFNRSFTNWKNNSNASFFTVHQKQTIFRQANFDYYIELEANEEVFSTKPHQFVTFLKETLQATHLVVGFDFRFGVLQQGDVTYLQKHFPASQLTVIKRLQDKQGHKISSSAVKSWLRVGQITRVNKLVKYPYSHRGVVIKGAQMGRKLGYPTANQKITTPLLIPYGVYIATVIVKQQQYIAMTCYYEKNADQLLETYIFDFDQDIYNETIEVQFLKYLRPSLIPTSWDELKSWMHDDELETKQFFKQ